MMRLEEEEEEEEVLVPGRTIIIPVETETAGRARSDLLVIY